MAVYDAFRAAALRILKVPDKPEPPAGSSGSQLVFRAAPAFYRYRLMGWAIVQAAVAVGVLIFALTLVAGAVGVGQAGWVFALLIVPLVVGWLVQLAFSYGTLRLDYDMRWYMVSDRALRIREGVVLVREMTMTFANIQNISVSQGPLQRLFGISDLKVESAGGGSATKQQGGELFDLHTGYFRGIDNAEEVRDLMLARLKKLRGAGLGEGDHEDADHDVGRVDARATAPAGEHDAWVSILTEVRDEARRLREAAEDH